MTDPGRRFDPAELLGGTDSAPNAAELADAFAAARALESYASGDRIRPTDDFEDRVMAAVALEPASRVVVQSGSAVRGGRPAAFLVAVRDAWAIATRGGRPMAVRAQALGFVLLVIVAAGSLGGVAVVGVGSFLAPQPTPGPSLQAIPIENASPDVPTPSPSPDATPSPTPSPEPTPTPTQAPTPTPTTDLTGPATGTPAATETPRPTETAQPTETSGSTETPSPGETLKPGETPHPSDDHGGSSGGG